MANARILQACDAAVALILAGWKASSSPPGDDDAVTRVYAPSISFTLDSPPPIVGRQVFVFPGPYQATTFTRADQLRDYKIRVLIVEQYSEAEGDPPEAWVDVRVNFCEQMIFNPLVNPALNLIDEMFPALEEQAVVDLLYHDDKLLKDKVFWSVMTFPFQEDTLQTGGVSL